tara:strand:+ start:460 stop:627 length:168 start_codon:yes stop_codon:yes gene_type:complete
MNLDKYSDEEKKLIKLLISYKLKNKGRDLTPVYKYGYELKLNDEQIGNCMRFIGF